MTDNRTLYARVVVNITARALNKFFTYEVPSDLEGALRLGSVVEVPFGKRVVAAFVVELVNQLSAEELHYTILPIQRILSVTPFWGDELLSLASFMRRYYCCSWFEGLRVAVPCPVLKMATREAGREKPVRKVRQKELSIEEPVLYPAPALNEEQQQALQIISAGRAMDKPVLLFGVTGSGKTEVYLHAVQETLRQGAQAAVLVPELSLTPQAVERYRGRLGNTVGVLHSALSEGERRNYWWAFRQGDLNVALGTRSAVFAPLDKLGLIVVDEEHDSSYKQENAPRYHARQVAYMRARRRDSAPDKGHSHPGCALVFGSATPSIESFYAARNGQYLLASMTQRPGGRSLPETELVDMRRWLAKSRLLSPPLADGIKQRLAVGEQVVLLLNRRGFAKFLQCSNCGYIPKCRNCSISLTWHRQEGVMRCHYCNYAEPVPDYCPQCRNISFMKGAPGTERLLREVQELVPQARIARMDHDTVSRVGSHEKILQEFASGEANILLGTQMIAKGLDYPNVTLVGILRADAELSVPDFRAAERCFQLIEQAAGRAGRGGRPGQVIIQAADTEHYALQMALRHDYTSLYEEEVALRREVLYPPFCHLVRLLVTAQHLPLLQALMDHLGGFLRKYAGSSLQILGPVLCPLEKLKNRYRMHIILKGQETLPMVDLIRRAIGVATKSFSRGVMEQISLNVDPDPQNLS